MSAFLHKLFEVGIEQVQEFWANNGDDIIEAGQTVLETAKDGMETIIENAGEIIDSIL